jgi:hypothetical protein
LHALNRLPLRRSEPCDATGALHGKAPLASWFLFVLNRALRQRFQDLKVFFFTRGFVGPSMITGSSDGPRRRHGVRRLWKRIRSPAATPYGLEQVDERRVIERR